MSAITFRNWPLLNLGAGRIPTAYGEYARKALAGTKQHEGPCWREDAHYRRLCSRGFREVESRTSVGSSWCVASGRAGAHADASCGVGASVDRDDAQNRTGATVKDPIRGPATPALSEAPCHWVTRIATSVRVCALPATNVKSIT